MKKEWYAVCVNLFLETDCFGEFTVSVELETEDGDGKEIEKTYKTLMSACKGVKKLAEKYGTTVNII